MGRARVEVGGLMRVGVVFPGQGSQALGMGVDVARAYPAAMACFKAADRVLGYDLLALCENGPEEQLRETRFSQPAIYAVNVALARAVGDGLEPVASAGHSFGEYCSLTIADALAYETALDLVHQRGLAMQRAAELARGAMAAVLGLDDAPLRSAVNDAIAQGAGRVQLANFNQPGQIVISGDEAAVKLAGELAMAAGAKRVVPLNVSGAWHSELMAPAREAFAPHVERAAIAMPAFPVISNVDAQPYADVAQIRRNLVRSVTDEVRWHETALQLIAVGVELIVEFGASPVLAPMMKRVAGAPKAVHVGDAAGVERLRAMLAPVAR